MPRCRPFMVAPMKSWRSSLPAAFSGSVSVTMMTRMMEGCGKRQAFCIHVFSLYISDTCCYYIVASFAQIFAFVQSYTLMLCTLFLHSWFMIDFLLCVIISWLTLDSFCSLSQVFLLSITRCLIHFYFVLGSLLKILIIQTFPLAFSFDTLTLYLDLCWKFLSYKLSSLLCLFLIYLMYLPI